MCGARRRRDTAVGRLKRCQFYGEPPVVFSIRAVGCSGSDAAPSHFAVAKCRHVAVAYPSQTIARS